MLWEAVRGEDTPDRPRVRTRRHGLAVLLATAIGTSLDAMAVGVTLAFLDADITVAAAAIGLATFLIATVGLLLGRSDRIAEGLGGAGLVALGAKILLEHTLLA